MTGFIGFCIVTCICITCGQWEGNTEFSAREGGWMKHGLSLLSYKEENVLALTTALHPFRTLFTLLTTTTTKKKHVRADMKARPPKYHHLCPHYAHYYTVSTLDRQDWLRSVIGAIQLRSFALNGWKSSSVKYSYSCSQILMWGRQRCLVTDTLICNHAHMPAHA